MLSNKQLAALPPRVRALVLRLAAECAWQQIRDLMSLDATQQSAIADVMANGNDKKGKYFGEVSVAKSQ